MKTTGKKDYYEILGVPRDADEKQLKTAYRKLARKYHPDLNRGDPSAESRFKEVSEAFAVLSDAEKRAKYDRGGHEAFDPGFDPFAGFDVRAAGLGDLEDLFGGLFGGAFGGTFGGAQGRRIRVRKGNDLQMELPIDFLDAVRGTTVRLRVPRQAGERRTEEVQVRIPVGTQDGARLRVAGKGDLGAGGGPAGDLYLVIRVRPHPLFRREGSHLVCDVPIGIVEATLGAEVDVPTLDGKSTIRIPAGTRSGQRLRLSGKGVPAAGGRPAGDLFAVVQIHPPKRLDRESQRLLEKLQARMKK